MWPLSHWCFVPVIVDDLFVSYGVLPLPPISSLASLLLSSFQGPEYPEQQYDTWRWNYCIFLWVWAGLFVVLEAVSWLFWLKNRKEGQEEQEALKTVEP